MKLNFVYNLKKLTFFIIFKNSNIKMEAGNQKFLKKRALDDQCENYIGQELVSMDAINVFAKSKDELDLEEQEAWVLKEIPKGNLSVNSLIGKDTLIKYLETHQFQLKDDKYEQQPDQLTAAMFRRLRLYGTDYLIFFTNALLRISNNSKDPCDYLYFRNFCLRGIAIYDWNVPKNSKLYFKCDERSKEAKLLIIFNVLTEEIDIQSISRLKLSSLDSYKNFSDTYNDYYCREKKMYRCFYKLFQGPSGVEAKIVDVTARMIVKKMIDDDAESSTNCKQFFIRVWTYGQFGCISGLSLRKLFHAVYLKDYEIIFFMQEVDLDEIKNSEINQIRQVAVLREIVEEYRFNFEKHVERVLLARKIKKIVNL